jgi:hypothetical protein
MVRGHSPWVLILDRNIRIMAMQSRQVKKISCNDLDITVGPGFSRDTFAMFLRKLLDDERAMEDFLRDIPLGLENFDIHIQERQGRP